MTRTAASAVGLVLFAWMSVSLAHAQIVPAAPTVKITRFEIFTVQLPLAELCGVVRGATQPQHLVRVTVDPKSKVPAQYMVTVGEKREFCVMVATLTGQAEAFIDGVSATSEWAEATRH